MRRGENPCHSRCISHPFSLTVLGISVALVLPIPSDGCGSAWAGGRYGGSFPARGVVMSRPPAPIRRGVPPIMLRTAKIPDPPPTAGAAKTPVQQARPLVLAAKAAFLRQDYATALAATDKALPLVPKNSDLQQFRSLIFFAAGDYKRASAAAYDALLLGPTWNWQTLSSLYRDTALYADQYRALGRVAAERPRSLEAHFLLAYHHLMLGHLEPGEAELTKVLDIRPGEPLSARLRDVVHRLRPSAESQVARAAPPPTRSRAGQTKDLRAVPQHSSLQVSTFGN